MNEWSGAGIKLPARRKLIVQNLNWLKGLKRSVCLSYLAGNWPHMETRAPHSSALVSVRASAKINKIADGKGKRPKYDLGLGFTFSVAPVGKF